MTSPDGSGNGWVPVRREEIDGDILRQVTAMIDLIPPLPIHVHDIVRIVSDYESSASEVTRLASSDPVFASRILNTVNSAYYALPKKTDNLRLAIVLLGYSEVRNIALRCGISGVLGDGGTYRGYTTRSLWKHSYLASVCAETFEANRESNRAGVLLTFGLLHDIGKFALVYAAKVMRDKKIKIKGIPGLVGSPYAIAREQELFGVNHAIVGAMISREWGLDRVSDIIEFHHYPSFFAKDDVPSHIAKDVAVVSVSDYLVNLYTGQRNLLPEPSPEFLRLLGITPPLKDMLTPELRKKLDKAKEFLTCIS